MLSILAFAATADAKPAKKRRKQPRTVHDADWAKTKAARYAALAPEACLTELDRRKLAFTLVQEAPGVRTPVRLNDGFIGRVLWRTDASEADRASSPYEVMDCRLLVAVADLSERLEERGIREVRIFSAWRPPRREHPPHEPATRHPGGLAIDIRELRFAPSPEGKIRTLIVKRDWTPKIGSPPCEGAPQRHPDARELREIFCETAKERMFSSMLGPNYDRAHHNHFHFEITPNVRWRLVL